MKQYKYTINGAQFDVTIDSIVGSKAKVEVNGIPFEVEMQGSSLVEEALPTVTTDGAAPAAAPAAPAAAEAPAAPAAKSGPGRVHLLRLHSLVSLQRSWLAKVKPLRRVRLFSYWRL